MARLKQKFVPASSHPAMQPLVVSIVFSFSRVLSGIKKCTQASERVRCLDHGACLVCYSSKWTSFQPNERTALTYCSGS
jgi:hypothetical protein